MATDSPHITPFDHPLEPGNHIIVRGALVGDKFDINLSLGPDMVYRKSTGDDVALHITYSRGSRNIILNSFERGHWGAEEQFNASFIQEQTPFEIRVTAHPDRFEVFVDDIKLADFFHRLPLQAVRFVCIAGGISLQLVDVGNRSSREQRDTREAHALEKLDPSLLTPGNTLEKLDPSVLTPGNAIVVRGSPTGAKFDINLAYGPDMVYQKPTGDNVALHVSYSGGSRRIILNSFEGGHWGAEEQFDASSIRDGTTFEIRIQIEQGRFGIILDNQKLADFNFRLPLNQIQYIYIVGDINLQSLDTGARGPSQPQGDAARPGPIEQPTGPLLPVPYRLKLPQFFAPGHKLVIVGTPNSDANKFHVNLYAGHLNGFHNLANFKEKTTYRDSRSKGEDWDKKAETDSKSGFPYTPGKQFQLVYAAEEDAFQVYVDGVHHFTYKHRLPPNVIGALGIEGNLKLHDVKFE